MKSIYRELGLSLIYFVVVAVIILLTGLSHAATWQTLVNVILFICIAWLSLIIIKNHVFPDVDFQKEIQKKNTSAGLVMLGLAIMIGLVIGFAVLAIFWYHTGDQTVNPTVVFPAELLK